MGEVNGHDDALGLGAASGLWAEDRDERLLDSAKRYEIIVRMADGSSRVINHATPASWRLGERVMVIDGTKPSSPIQRAEVR